MQEKKTHLLHEGLSRVPYPRWFCKLSYLVLEIKIIITGTIMTLVSLFAKIPTVKIQGVSFNWSYRKNHKYGKKLKYQNWSYPKIHSIRSGPPLKFAIMVLPLKLLTFR